MTGGPCELGSALGLRRLAALIAAFAPGRAERLVGLVAASASEDVVAHAVALARRPRGERLTALATAFAEAAAYAQGAPAGGHPLWQRLARESRELRASLRPGSTARTPVRLANAAPRLDAGFMERGAPADAGTRRVRASAR